MTDNFIAGNWCYFPGGRRDFTYASCNIQTYSWYYLNLLVKASETNYTGSEIIQDTSPATTNSPPLRSPSDRCNRSVGHLAGVSGESLHESKGAWLPEARSKGSLLPPLPEPPCYRDWIDTVAQWTRSDVLRHWIEETPTYYQTPMGPDTGLSLIERLKCPGVTSGLGTTVCAKINGWKLSAAKLIVMPSMKIKKHPKTDLSYIDSAVKILKPAVSVTRKIPPCIECKELRSSIPSVRSKRRTREFLLSPHRLNEWTCSRLESNVSLPRSTDIDKYRYECGLYK
ncbi:hypothetical protein CBL_03497 [Carabus blaptoides fortunei]